MNVIDFLASQLVSAYPSAEWNAAGVDRSRELALMMNRAGIEDISKLKLIRSVYQLPFDDVVLSSEYVQAYGWPPLDFLDNLLANSFAFEYENRKIGFLGTPNRNDSAGPGFRVLSFGQETDTGILDFRNVPGDGHLVFIPTIKNREIFVNYEKAFEINESGAVVVAWSAEGKGHVSYLLVPNGVSWAVIPSWGSSSDAASIRSFVIQAGMLIATAYGFTGTSAGSALGQQIVGPTISASYPALTNAIGNAALGTVFSGGDIETAVKNAVAQYIGGVVSGQVAGTVRELTDSGALASAAGAAANAFVRGGDVQNAIKNTLIVYGANQMDDYFASNMPAAAMPEDFGYADNSAPFVIDPEILQPLRPIEAPFIDSNFTSFNDPSSAISARGFWDFDPLPALAPIEPLPDRLSDIPISDLTVTTPDLPNVNLFPEVIIDNPLNPQRGIASNFPSFRDVTQFALAAMQLNNQRIALQSNQPVAPLQRQTRAVTPSGTVRTVQRDGTIQTRNQNGQITVERIPPRQPMTTQNGEIVTNNGDGTFTLISPDGSSQIVRYRSDSAFGDLDPKTLLLYGGGGLLALFALSRLMRR